MPAASPSNHRFDDEIRRRQNARPGRIVLAGIFLVIAGLNTFTFLSVRPAEKDLAGAWIFLSELWITVPLVAIWFRKQWGRYLVGALCFLISVLSALFAPHYFRTEPSLPTYVPLSIAIYFVTFLIIVYLPAIRILTRRRY